MNGFGTIRQKLRHCDFLLHRFMFRNENLAGKRRSSPSSESCCLQGIRFPCAESLPRLVQPPLSPLPGQAEPFHAVQAPAEQRLLHFRLRLPISRTRGHGSRISRVIPVGSQNEALPEAFPSRSEPIGPSRPASPATLYSFQCRTPRPNAAFSTSLAVPVTTATAVLGSGDRH